ncbi:MAG: methylenetetrahydrofolate--tRNA-(uracil(54)-C(5))-methyltransferase (FADH(2)-oxidizing) TrmFO, partial [Gemmatimonadota bacterium]|nr:methylenetetrahydrofolate--tRNA-(uracil(54)-C(5))-methyltransferase (FADH(2)-oxidizing) TrmFO [Gemmatimonadota bacterium]
MSRPVVIVGGGLAGSEAALQCARLGVECVLYEMRPERATPAHQTDRLAELVCSNSFKTTQVENAHGLLKAELERLGCRLLEIAYEARIPAGSALGVDREVFAALVTEAVEGEGAVTVVREERTRLDPDEPTIVATGPLTSDALSDHIAEILGEDHLAFYDAISPIVSEESLVEGEYWAASRWGKGGPDYLNCPMDEPTYEAFVDGLLEADLYPLKEFEREATFFEGCLPIEEMARRGRETLRYGPMKPVGLPHPETGEIAHAVLQLRKENVEGTMFNLVGCQTRMRYPEQRRVFGIVPALAEAEYLRMGQVHRNTFLQHPAALDPFGRPVGDPTVTTEWPRLFFAGQLTGVEGYVESIASGLMAAWNVVRVTAGEEPALPPPDSMIGGLYRYLHTADPEGFQPMNANFGLVPPCDVKASGKRAKRAAQAARALESLDGWLAAHP